MKLISEVENKITCGDCIEVMKELPDNSIDLIVSSPPYNLGINKTFDPKLTKSWKGKWASSKLQTSGYDLHNDYMPEADYIAWQQKVLAECFRLIKETGAIFYNQKWRVQKGIWQMRPEIYEGLPIRQIIIWQKAGGINFNEGYYLPNYEPIYIIAKPKFKLAPKVNAIGSVWSITPDRTSWHPAAMPLELATRCCQATTGDLILDPFSGSGTTCLAAKQLGKKYIGIDLSPDYCIKAEQRIKEA